MTLNRTRICAASTVLAALAMFSTASHADRYVGLDGSALAFDNSVEGAVDAKGLRLRIGARINEVFDIEGHFGGGSNSETDSFDKLGVGYIGGYLKGYVPLGRYSAFYGLAGFTGIELTQTLPNGSRFSDDKTAFSFGIGLETRLSRNLDLTADYIRYSMGDDEEFSDVSAVSMGLKLYF